MAVEGPYPVTKNTLDNRYTARELNLAGINTIIAVLSDQANYLDDNLKIIWDALTGQESIEHSHDVEDIIGLEDYLEELDLASDPWVISDTEPTVPVNGTIWVDTN